jgi:small multidrug resistance pump
MTYAQEEYQISQKRGDEQMGWLFLILGIITEVVGTVSMKLSQGFSNWLPTTIMYISYIISLSMITIAMKSIDLSIVYAIWCAVGAFFITIIGIYFFSEPVSMLKIASIALIIIGVVGLKISSI